MAIEQFLDDNLISFQRCDHPAVYTTEEADRLVPPLPGAGLKNLFLRDKSGREYYLLVVPKHKQVDLAALARSLGISRLSLASPERLRNVLGIEPGAVSMLALINDTQKAVQLLLDAELASEEAYQCHPLVNTATLVISKQGLERFIALTGHIARMVPVPER